METAITKFAGYLFEILGAHAAVSPMGRDDLNRLPVYINETYRLYKTVLFDTEVVLVYPGPDAELSILQTEKHIRQITTLLNRKAVLVPENVQAYHRKRLIEKRISFIVPGKQMYLPDLLVDLRDPCDRPAAKQARASLLPSAQFLLIYHLLHRRSTWQLEEHPFKEIARRMGYTPMAITNAVDDLKYHELVAVKGDKEKQIRFRYDRQELWNLALQQNLLVNPVLKTVFVDEKPKDLFLLQSNVSALPEYTDLGDQRQMYFAIEKTVYYGLQKTNGLVNPNEYEGNVALEIWKYDPLPLATELDNDRAVVDPLSLYLSVRESHDERIEMALNQLTENRIW